MTSLNFDKLVLVHTLSYSYEDLIVDAAKKIEDYINYRLDRE